VHGGNFANSNSRWKLKNPAKREPKNTLGSVNNAKPVRDPKDKVSNGAKLNNKEKNSIGY
jgi:hypothetical protein